MFTTLQVYYIIIFLIRFIFPFPILDYETLRALDSDNVSTAPSMTEEEINALPVHKYRVSVPQK